MRIKKTSKNQVTLPEKILKAIPDTEYFDISLRNGIVMLRPVAINEAGVRLAAVGRKMHDLGIELEEIDRALKKVKTRPRRR